MNLANLQINVYFILFITVFTVRNLLELRIIPKVKSRGKGEISLLMFAILFFAAGISVGYYLLIATSVNILLFISGLIIFVSFHTARLVCVKKMGQSYSQLITPGKEATLITSGIFSIIRHPLYFFYVFELTGLLLIKFNLIAMVAVVMDIIITLLRIRHEERLLIEKYGNAYITYREKTWKLIPYLC